MSVQAQACASVPATGYAISMLLCDNIAVHVYVLEYR